MGDFENIVVPIFLVLAICLGGLWYCICCRRECQDADADRYVRFEPGIQIA